MATKIQENKESQTAVKTNEISGSGLKINMGTIVALTIYETTLAAINAGCLIMVTVNLWK
jgi:hypothetical protein